MKSLVAGGAGFIGSHLCDALLTEGGEVVCVDDFSLGTKENVKHLQNNRKFKMYEQDICDLDAVKQIFETEKVDYVFHLAANSDIQASAKNPMIEYANTYTTTFNICECMRVCGVEKLFFASTSAVYGEKGGVSVAEDCPKLAPVSYYGGAKLGCEGIISAYSFMNSFSSLIFRFPNVIGPRLTHGVIFDFLVKLNANPHELEILGDGNQQKPYMHVLDLIDGIMQFKDARQGVTTYNIGVDTQSTVNAIADILCEEMGLQNVKYSYTGGCTGWNGDVPVFAYNLDKIHAAGWSAKLTSDETVRQTIRVVVGK